MKLKSLCAAICMMLTASSLLANPQVFNLTWSGNTDFIQNYIPGSPVSTAMAYGQLTLDTDLLVPAPPTPGAPNGSYPLPNPGVLSFTMTITGASSGNGTFTLSDFVAENGVMIFDTLNTPFSYFDLSQNLIGQTLIDGITKFGVKDPLNPNLNVGDFVFSSGTGPINPNAPTKDDFSFIMLTAGGSGDYLQLVSMVPEPATMLTGIMTLALSAGVIVRSARRRAASR